MRLSLHLLIIGLVLAATVVNAKKHKSDKVKAEKIKDKVTEKHIKPDHPTAQPDKPKQHHHEHKQHKTGLKKPKNVAIPPPPIPPPTIDESVVEETSPPTPKKLFKHKHVKALSEYEQCKLECKKRRDQVSAQEYIDQLEAELQSAKDLLSQQQLQESTRESPPIIEIDVSTAVPPKTTQEAHQGIPIVEVLIHDQELDHDEL